MSAQATEPVIPGDFADPSVIKVDSVYYATGTSSEWAPHFPVFKSSDLKTWRQTGYVFDKSPEWTVGSFWAPEYYKIGQTYYLYYTARRKSDNRSYIGVATSQYPDHGFTDHGVLIEHGKEAIDAFVFNDNGQLYITFKAYGLDDRPIELLGSRLSADGLKTEGELFSLLKDSSRIGMEGQSILKKDNYYYLFYSVGNCCGQDCSYAVHVARATSLKGPYQLYSSNPILHENDSWKCMGHGTFVPGDKGETYYLHHGYNRKSNVFTGREAMLSALTWQGKDGWPALKIASNNMAVPSELRDDFNTTALSNFWQWDFRHADPSVKIHKGTLHLSGTTTSDNLTGIALTVRPTSDSFEITTSVINRNKALKGLVVYGDAGVAIGVGVQGDSIKVWKVDNNRHLILHAIKAPSGITSLKLAMSEGRVSKFFYQAGQASWKQVGSAEEIKSLPQWDRSPRLGLHYKGNEQDSAEFSYFSLRNL
ncbi:family 43 glycosylhydrolase [Chitinophaga rhizophila]|nr:family 43 glycosylhydrolase [Chitinophaga rhizophila]